MTSTVTAVSALFVPGSRPDRFAAAVGSEAGLAILDLEDSVAAEDKDVARSAVAAHLRSTRSGVRINGFGASEHAADVAAVIPRASAVMIPKAEPGRDLADLGRRLHDAGVDGVALIETALGIVGAADVARTTGIMRLAFGSLDLAAQIGVDPTDHYALAHARSALVLASAAAGLPAPFDGVWADPRDLDGLRAEAEQARRLGFGAKLCIHPRQVPVAEEVFRPGAAAVAWATRVLEAHRSLGEPGVFTFEGQMVDKPVLDRARAVFRLEPGARG